MELSGETDKLEAPDEIKIGENYISKQIKILDDMDNDDDNIIQISESSNMQLGSGTRIWECGMILSKYFIKQNEERKLIIKDKSILELGSGTGYLSILLAALGSTAYATDLPELKDLLERNIYQNLGIIAKNNGFVSNFDLDWNKTDKESLKLKFKEYSIKNLDYILAADVVFNREQLLSIVGVMLKIYEVLLDELKAKPKDLPAGYLCYKSRQEDIDEEIVSTFEKAGFETEQVEESEMDPCYKSSKINIFKLLYRPEID